MFYTSVVAKRHSRPFHKRIAIDIAGFSLIILALLFGWLPGPGGIPLALAGLALLALNYEWAENLLNKLKKRFKDVFDKTKKR